MEIENKQEKTNEAGGEENKEKGKFPAIRTFKTDTAEYVKEKDVSLIDVAVADAKKKSYLLGQEEAVGRPKGMFAKKFLIAALILVFLAALGAAGFFAYKFLIQPRQSATQSELPKPYFISDEQREATMEEASRAVNYLIPENEVLYAPVVKNEGEEKQLVSSKEFFDYFGITLPFGLSDALENKFMLGAVKKNGENRPYLVFKIKNYDFAFAGMMKWEKTMAADIKKIFPIPRETVYNGAFEDREIFNHDARVLYSPDGQSAILYSFLNKDFLAISVSEEALKEILNRLTSPRYLID